MKKLINIILLLALLLSLTACSNAAETKNETSKETSKETSNETSKETQEKKITLDEIDQSKYKYVENGSFYVNNKGVVIEKDKVKDQGYKIAEWYFDPLCPFCMKIEKDTSPYLLDIMGDKTIINYKPMTFLGRQKGEDPNNLSITYSDVMSSIILSMAENDSELVGQYIVKVINQDFVDSLSKLNDTKLQDESMKKVYTEELSGKNWEAIKKQSEEMMQTARNLTNFVKNDEELKSKTLEGNISVPLIYIRGEEKILDIYQENMDYKALLEGKLK